jgi:RNA polymerase sigma-70 factor, ECF subfamily
LAITRWGNTNGPVKVQSDLAVEQGFIARERWALEAFYVQHSKTFYSAAYSVLRDAEEAQDCVHDVLLRLWNRPNTFASGKGSLKAFVAVCIRNEAVSRLRLRNREPELQRRLAARIEHEEFEPFDFVEHNRLVRAIDALPQAQRRTIIMSYFRYLTHREIAEQLGEPIGTIKSRLSTALHRLRDALSRNSIHD